MDFNTVDFESMLAAKEAAYWSFWTMIGTWVAGLATLSAVIVSLYLSMRAAKITVSGVVGLRDLVIPGISNIQRVLSITILNKGIPTAHIVNIGWRITAGNLFERFFLKRNKYYHQIFQLSDVTPSKWPAKMDHGETVSIIIKIDEQEWIKKWAELLSLSEIKKLRFAITNSFGKTNYVKPDDFLINQIIRVKNENNY